MPAIINRILTTSLIFISLLVTGCSGKVNVTLNQPEKISTQNSYFIVENEHSTKIELIVYPVIGLNYATVGTEDGAKIQAERYEDTANYIKEELNKYGHKATVGSEENIPLNSNVIIRFIDEWQWDVVMYLKKFLIQFIDPKNKKVIAEAKYKSHYFHDYPTTKKEVPKMIKAILNNKEEESI